MNGNVWEVALGLVRQLSEAAATTQLQGADVGSHRVVRGGSWNFESQYCRVSNRFSGYPGFRYYFVGFRGRRRAPSVKVACPAEPVAQQREGVVAAKTPVPRSSTRLPEWRFM